VQHGAWQTGRYGPGANKSTRRAGRVGDGAGLLGVPCCTEYDHMEPAAVIRPTIPRLSFSPGKLSEFRTSIRRLFGSRPELVRAAERGRTHLSVSAAAVP
jgi:hypothetical protein